MEIIETLINGLSSGSTYAMIALGYTMVYVIAKMLNFAHGDVIMVGGYTLHVVMSLMRQPVIAKVLAPVIEANPVLGSLLVPLIGLLVAIIFCTLLGITVEKVAYKPLRGASPLAVLITAIGVSYLLQSAAQMIFGTAQKNVVVADLGNLQIGPLKIQYHILITLICSFVIMIALTIFIKKTKTGRAMIAVSEDRGAAQLMGINVNKIISITFAIGSALAAFAGFFMLMKAPALQNTFGAMPGIKAFTAAVIGGIGSIPGAMLGGVLMGIVEAVTLKTPLAPYTDAIEFMILIIILLVKPTGILGKVRREKV